MIGINTSRDIALVKHVLALLDGPYMQFPGDAVGEQVAIVDAKYAITETAVSAGPQPTPSLLLFDKLHKSIAYGAYLALASATIGAKASAPFCVNSR